MDEMVTMLPKALVFRKLNEKQIAKIYKLAVSRNLAKGQIISLYDESFPYVLFVERGSIQIVKESDKGNAMVMRTYKGGDVFWGHAVIDDGPTPGTIQAFEADTKIYLWHKDHLLPILKQNAEAIFEISKVVMERLRVASNKIEQLAFNDVMTRLASLILEEFYKANKKHQIPRNLTLEEIAKRVGTNRDVVCRLLYRISNDDIMEITRHYFVIKDLDALMQIAKVERK